MPTDDLESDGAPPRSGALEIRGSADGLLDEPFELRVRGAGPDARLVWRARYRDDDGRVWRSAGLRCEDLATGWSPLKDGTGDMAALRSLRPVSIDLRVESADGRSAARTLNRLLAADGVRTRRWRDGLAATLHVPPPGTPCASVIVDATGSPAHASVAAVAAPLLASRGALVLVVAGIAARAPGDPIAIARERLSAVPGASPAIVVLSVAEPIDGGADADAHAHGNARDGDADADAVVLPPGVGIREPHPHAAAARAQAWDRLLERLGALPRRRPSLS